MDTELKFTPFVRKPFKIDSLKITKENIAEVAKFVGTLVDQDGPNPYIVVDRRLVPNVIKVFPGYYLTRMDKSVRCYSGFTFKKNFVEVTASIEELIKTLGVTDKSPSGFPNEGKIENGDEDVKNEEPIIHNVFEQD